MRILAGVGEDILPEVGPLGSDVTRKGFVLGKVRQSVGWICLDKEESSLK